VQAEDELAAIHMALGAAFGGTPAMTATSGPGLSLMVEALGLAVAAEIPVLVVDVQRGGPSTGLPTGTEQGDLWIAVHGLHGDAPHLVVAPSGPHDLASTAEWGMRLAEALQTPTLLLSDQFLGQALTVVDEPLRAPAVAEGRRPTSNGAYERYALTASGVSPRALPGTAGQAYTATGLSKTEGAVPSGAPEDHAAQLEKRFQKLQRFDYGDFWGSVEGDPEAPTAILTWGSPAGAAREASQRLASEGVPVRVVVPRLLSPLPVRQLGEALRGVERLVVLEQTHGGQFFRYVRSEMALPGEVTSLRRPGPLSFRPGEIVDILRPSAVTPTAQLPLGSAS
jgi:2-oxoglutarate ferredoxin oxidoreductase subunit alpha